MKDDNCKTEDEAGCTILKNTHMMTAADERLKIRSGIIISTLNSLFFIIGVSQAVLICNVGPTKPCPRRDLQQVQDDHRFLFGERIPWYGYAEKLAPVQHIFFGKGRRLMYWTCGNRQDSSHTYEPVMTYRMDTKSDCSEASMSTFNADVLPEEEQWKVIHLEA